ncbi:hypothetical protein AB0Q95_04410 [Streptomyces sp. NPDC059900]|uniref:hypothetical protein n=1 Tax=Streptomyces sp. NPDC059900 TaxID=3155816 RepID=UPI00342C2F84
MQKPIAIATFALITFGTLATTAAVANASGSPSEGRGHTVQRPAHTGSKPADKPGKDSYSTTLEKPAGIDSVPSRQR